MIGQLLPIFLSSKPASLLHLGVLEKSANPILHWEQMGNPLKSFTRISYWSAIDVYWQMQ